jgi:transposase
MMCWFTRPVCCRRSRRADTPLREFISAETHVPDMAVITICCRRPMACSGAVQVRCRYRIYPSPGQQQPLARAFGCARVVYNDCLRLREEARAAGVKISDSQVQRRVVTLAKRTPEREWLAEAPSVALVQACNDARRAYRNWFDSLSGRRKGRRIGRFVPSSRVCSDCGVSDGPKPLGVRRWSCAACGAVHDRDVNAARNILAAGRAERRNACGGGVRPPLAVAAAGAAGTHQGAA